MYATYMTGVGHETKWLTMRAHSHTDFYFGAYSPEDWINFGDQPRKMIGCVPPNPGTSLVNNQWQTILV